MYYQYLEKYSCQWNSKIILCEPASSEKEKKREYRARDQIGHESDRESIGNFFGIFVMKIPWQKIIETFRHSKIIIRTQNSHETHHGIESTQLLNRNRIGNNDLDDIPRRGYQKREKINPDIFAK